MRRGRLRACGEREGGRDEGGLVSSVAGTKAERREKGCFGLKVIRRSTLFIKKFLVLVFFPAVWQVV